MILWWACLGAELAALVGVGASIRSAGPKARTLAATLVFPPCVDLVIGYHNGETGGGFGLAHALGMWRVDCPYGPFTGAAAGIYLTELAMCLVWPAALAAGARRLFCGHWLAAWPFAAGWTVAVAVAAVAHPLPRGWMAPILHAWELLSVAVSVPAVVQGWRSRDDWGAPHLSMLVLLAIELAVAVVGPWRNGQPFADWDAARLLYLMGFACVAIISGVGLVRRRSWTP